MTNPELERLRGHILLAGCSDLTEIILEELPRTTDVLVVAQDSPQDQLFADSNRHFLSGDPTDEEILTQACLSDAQAILVATGDDAENALVILTARHSDTDIHIVSSSSNSENIAKLKRAGANTVISPQSMAGQHLVRSTLG
ncbi:NAD(P)-binding protein (plasmid) [Halococcus morrhuae DSM 1307]|uniref:NAD(P)-binding protein n=1 Tax=Halococcus morrhuae TaxID=2250 RepID=UPI0009B5AC3C|nr:NAD(P)-binding protein [Halococcus morrhuae]